MQTHPGLGSNGTVAVELSRALAGPAVRIRQVSRTPRRPAPADEFRPADLLDPGATSAAVAGSTTEYLVAGLRSDAALWEAQ